MLTNFYVSTLAERCTQPTVPVKLMILQKNSDNFPAFSL